MGNLVAAALCSAVGTATALGGQWASAAINACAVAVNLAVAWHVLGQGERLLEQAERTIHSAGRLIAVLLSAGEREEKTDA
jgi:hypothetical protein